MVPPNLVGRAAVMGWADGGWAGRANDDHDHG